MLCKASCSRLVIECMASCSRLVMGCRASRRQGIECKVSGKQVMASKWGCVN